MTIINHDDLQLIGLFKPAPFEAICVVLHTSHLLASVNPYWVESTSQRERCCLMQVAISEEKEDGDEVHKPVNPIPLELVLAKTPSPFHQSGCQCVHLQNSSQLSSCYLPLKCPLVSPLCFAPHTLVYSVCIQGGFEVIDRCLKIWIRQVLFSSKQWLLGGWIPWRSTGLYKFHHTQSIEEKNTNKTKSHQIPEG